MLKYTKEERKHITPCRFLGKLQRIIQVWAKNWTVLLKQILTCILLCCEE